MEDDAILSYLDKTITFWRNQKEQGNDIAIYYIDAYQSVRATLFGETLPEETLTKH